MRGSRFKVGDIVWFGISPLSADGPVKARIVKAESEWMSYDVEIIGKEKDGPVPALATEVRALNALERLAEET
jgi:hypothetical protein